MLDQTINRKFIDSVELDPDEWEIETDEGFKPITHIYKTVPYSIWELKTDNYNLKCADDHIVFADNYQQIFVKDLKAGDYIITKTGSEKVTSVKLLEIEPENMYDISVDSDEHRFYSNNILSHNTTTAVAFLLHSILFKKNYSVAVVANKLSMAKEIIGRLKTSYMYLPKWMQQGTAVWNAQSIELENGSKVMCDGTAAGSLRGNSFNLLLIDEFAHIPDHLLSEFFSSVYPTIVSGQTTKLIIISTPNGMNMFHKLWTDSINGRNKYIPTQVHWTQIPGRDEEFKNTTIANTSLRQWSQEFELKFLGGSDTLIDGNKLATLSYNTPIRSTHDFDVYEEPQPERRYFITVDVAEGVKQNYSAFVIFDITEIPYRVVAKYRSNIVDQFRYSTILYPIAIEYNNAFVLIEINKGITVATNLYDDLGYDNMILCRRQGRLGQVPGQGIGMKSNLGLNMDMRVKRQGCMGLKTLIEMDKLTVNDYNIIEELCSFIEKTNGRFEAENDKTDDLVICLVIFAWMVSTEYFKEISQTNLFESIKQHSAELTEEQFAYLGFYSNAVMESTVFEQDADGDIWMYDSDVNDFSSFQEKLSSYSNFVHT